MQRPRVAVFLEYFPPYMGSDRRIFELCKASQSAIDYLIIATPPLRFLAGRGDASLGSHRSMAPKNDKWVQESGLRGCKLGMPTSLESVWRHNVFVGYAISVFWYLAKAVSYTRKSGANMIVVAHPSYLTGVIGVTVARLLRRPVLLDCPDVWTPMVKEITGLPISSVRLRILYEIERWIAKAANAVIAATPYTKKYFVASGVDAEKVTILPNGVDTDRFAPSAKTTFLLNDHEHSEDQTVIFVGRLERWVGFEALIGAAKLVVTRRPNTKFLIVGDGTMRVSFERLVFQEGLGSNFVFLGFQPENAVPDLISDSDVAVSLFSNDVVSNASLPLKLFEYMSAGKPIVSTNQEGMVETITGHDLMLLAGPKDPAALGNAIINLLEDLKSADDMGAKARAYVLDGFSWKTLSEKFGELCLHLVGRSQ